MQVQRLLHTLCCLDEADDQSRASHQKEAILSISRRSHSNLPPEILSSARQGVRVFALSYSRAEPMLWNTRLGHPCWQAWLETSMAQLFFYVPAPAFD